MATQMYMQAYWRAQFYVSGVEHNETIMRKHAVYTQTQEAAVKLYTNVYREHLCVET